MLSEQKRTLGFFSLAAAAIIAVACGGGNDSTTTPTATGQPGGTSFDVSAPSGILGGDPEFNYSALVWQGYWLSRDHFGPFVMASGMGIPFEPPMEMIQQAMQMVAQNPGDPVMIPQNMAPLQAVFAAGSPKLVNDPRDFDPWTFRPSVSIPAVSTKRRVSAARPRRS